ncbi:MAG: SDR family NAD(P)-dependent oxidoreductase, partial [Nitrososphaeraceae archaeon]|jgi:NAD(P)-dependent dehydrogenase (short-subunit alcohol dehydrogenase family)
MNTCQWLIRMQYQNAKPPLKFSDKIVVITGSGTGIGQAIAKKFALNGASIIIMGRRKEPLDETSQILEGVISSAGSSGKIRAFPGVDVSDEVEVNEMFKTIKQEFGKVDIIVNNAGVSGPVKIFTNANFKEFKDCVAIHLTGTFWTSIQGLQVLEPGGEIITITTFFTEENRYDQRPYRFRTPYTAAQGAKNRLAEALAWELVEKGIRSVVINPGPVHSDRIYRTVYPKAAAEFLRIGGYPDLSSIEIEKAAVKLLPLLGESDNIISNGIKEIATEIAKSNNNESTIEIERLYKIISAMLVKIKEIAEKIQNNTAKMIVDGEFLAQDEVADMVLNLCDVKISRLINGKVIPNDRIFYPVKPVVGTSLETSTPMEVKDQVIVITISSSAKKDVDCVRQMAAILDSKSVKQTIILTSSKSNLPYFEGFHSHLIDLSSEESIRKIFNVIITKFGDIDAVVHFTGSYDYNLPLSSLTRQQWDLLVDNFVNTPSLITREAVNAMAPNGAAEEPIKFKGSKGIVVIVGPDSPIGKKISGAIRARSEVFRGALRPYTATVNQELADVLGSNIRLYLILAGNIEGSNPNNDKLQKSILQLISGSALKRNETVFYIDEARD